MSNEEKLTTNNVSSSGSTIASPPSTSIEEKPTNKKSNAVKMLLLLIVILATAAIFLGYIVYDKALLKNNSEDADILTENIALLNSEIVEKDGEKFLSEYDKINTPTKSAFVFGGKNIDYNETKNYKVIDLYISFTGAKSVDTIWNNIESFEGAMSNGDMIVVVHPVPTQNNIAVVMPQSLAKSAEENPDKTWELFVNYIAITKANNTNNGTFTSENMRETMISSAQELGYKSINKELMESTEFLSWIFDDIENIINKTSDSIPVIYVNGEKVDYKETSYVDTNKLFEEINKL